MKTSDSKITPELVQLVKRSRFNPIRTLTPEVLSTQLDSFAVGYLRDFALTGEAIKRRDDVMCVALPKREKATSRRDLVCQVLDGLQEPQLKRAEEHRNALRYFYENLTVSHALDRDVRGGYKLLVRQMMSAIGARYAVHEIVWEPRVVDGRDQLTARLNFVPLQFFEATTGKLRFLRNYLASIHGEDMPENEWLVTVGDGILEPLAVAYMFKQLSLKDWVSYNEKFGTPGVLGKTAAAKDSPEWQALADAVAAFSQDFAAVVNEGSSIDLIKSEGGSNLPFPPLVERMDRVIATICRGADLSTLSAGGGSGQGASLQGDESDLLEQDDAELISETLQHLSRIVIRFLFDEDPLAYAQIVVPERRDNADVRENVRIATEHNVPVGVEWLRDQLGLAAPSQGEEVLRRSAPPAGLAPGPGLMPIRTANIAAVGRNGILRAESLARLSVAQAEALKPLRDRLREVSEIEDDAAREAALIKLQADLPGLYKAISKDPTVAKAFEEIIGTALIDGAATAAKTRKDS